MPNKRRRGIPATKGKRRPPSPPAGVAPSRDDAPSPVHQESPVDVATGAGPSSGSAGDAPPEVGSPEQQLQLDQAVAAGEAARPEPPPAFDETATFHRLSDFAEAVDQEEADKKAAGAPTSSPTQQRSELVASLTAEDIADFLKLGFSLVAFRRGDHWVLADEEAEKISLWVKKSIERHGVEWVARWLPDIMAGVLLGYAIVRRIEVDRKLAAEKKKTDAAGKGAASGAHTTPGSR